MLGELSFLPYELLLEIITYIPYEASILHICKYLRNLYRPYIIYRFNTFFSEKFLSDIIFWTCIESHYRIDFSNISLTFRNHTFCNENKYVLDAKIHSIMMINCSGCINKSITDYITKIYIDNHNGPLYMDDIKNIPIKIITNTNEIIEENSIDMLDVSIINDEYENSIDTLFDDLNINDEYENSIIDDLDEEELFIF